MFIPQIFKQSRMSKINFLTGSVVLLLLLNAGTLVFMLQRRGVETTDLPRGNGAGPAAFIIQALQLDDKQQEQFTTLRGEHQRITRAIHEEDKRLHDAYFDLLKTDHPDKAQVDSLASLIGAQHKLMEAAAFEHFEKLRAICREDQKKLFDNTIDEIARRMAPRGPGGPPPPPGDGPPPGDHPDGPPR